MTAPLASFPLQDLLDALASKTPAPGGGAAAGLTGATACGLASMVIAYSLGKAALADHQDTLTAHATWLTNARTLFLRLADEDALAFPALQAAQKLPDDDETKAATLIEAIDAAVGAPRATLAAAGDLLRKLEDLPTITNRHLASDLAIAGVLGESAAASAAWNVRINLPLITDNARRNAIEADTTRLVSEAATRRAQIEAACAR
ncbi:MAG: cyclodeaminase/cyclohydrolase family protein [Planctomycetota bacterium]